MGTLETVYIEKLCETEKIAMEFSKSLKPGDVVTLDGDLGAGKTAFSKGVIKGLGTDVFLGSPTFTIVNCYEGKIPIYHFDVYRIQDSEEMYDVGYDEYVGGDGIALIEWANNIADILPSPRYEIIITKDIKKGEDYREITIDKK